MASCVPYLCMQSHPAVMEALAPHTWQALCGIAEGGGHVHLVMVYPSARGDAGFNDKLSVSYRLPVREDD